MKKFFLFAAVAASTLFLASCNKEDSRKSDNGDCGCIPAELTVGIRSASSGTKATGVAGDATDEAKVNTLQVLVFRGDALDAYGTISNSTEITLSCTAGERVVYALVNGQDLQEVQTKTAFLAKISKLSDNSLTSYEMIGVKDVTLPQSNTITIDVNRFASRVVIKKITNNLTSPALQALEFGVDEIYITNVAGDCKFSRIVGTSKESAQTPYSPTIWYNKLKNESANQIAAFHKDAPEYTIAYGSSKSISHYFYAYPNPSEASTTAAADFVNGGEWSARRTKLVLKCHIGPDTYYYPIILPVLENNKSYEINELTITRPGSDSEDAPVSFADATFEVNVIEWTAVLVPDINSGATDGTITL